MRCSARAELPEDAFMSQPNPANADPAVAESAIVAAVVERFEQAWEKGARPDLDEQLPAGGPLRRSVLIELVHVELERRLRAAEPARVEDYLHRYPELADAPDVVLDLLVQESEVRRQQEGMISIEEYAQRFPLHVEALQQRWQILWGQAPPATEGLPARELSPTGPVKQQPTSTPLGRLDVSFLAPPQQPGELGRLGPNRVLRLLGAGGMGLVFLAEDPRLNRFVALKVMRPELAAHPLSRERFLREARAAAAVRNDHVVTIYAADEDRGVPFVVMELLEGETLDARLRRQGRLPLAEVLRLGEEIAEGLKAAHRRGLVHRDVKPANIWLEGERSRVKLLDFGLVRAVSPLGRLTDPREIVGTPANMAPEQASGKPVDQKADLFGLGTVLYSACTGSTPFPGANRASVLTAVRNVQPPPPDQLNPAIPRGLSDLIMWLLSKDPGDRPSSAQQVLDVLGAIECRKLTMKVRSRDEGLFRPAPPEVPPGPDEIPSSGHESPAAGAVGARGLLAAGLSALGHLRFRSIEPTSRPTDVPAWRPPRRRVLAVWLVLLLLLAFLVPLVLLFTYRPPVVAVPSVPADTRPFDTETELTLRVVAGQPARLPLTVRRHGCREPIRITASELPPHVNIPPVLLPPGEERIELKVATERGALPMVPRISLTFEAGEQHVKAWLTLTVLLLPPGYRAVTPDVDRDVANLPSYRRIARDLDESLTVEFVLVPKRDRADPDTFYIMVDKVSVDLFHMYVKESPGTPPRPWNQDAAAHLPALHVSAQDAARCAAWLGGKLPTGRQWDKACGQYDRDGRPGPFLGDWSRTPRPDIAVNRAGPLPVGAAKDDRSFVGCRDLAGNGREWTSTLAGRSHRLDARDPPSGADVEVRGHSWAAPRPVFFDDLDHPDVQADGETTADLGFRVVLEPPGGP
jgi:serine/threonine protein kinase